MLLQNLEIGSGQLFGRNIRRPPLIRDQRDVHCMKKLMRSIRLRDHERVALLYDAPLEIRRVTALIRERIGGTLQILAASLRAPLAHRNTPKDSNSTTRAPLRPHSFCAMPTECSPMFGARYGSIRLREKLIGVRMCPNVPSFACSMGNKLPRAASWGSTSIRSSMS